MISFFRPRSILQLTLTGFLAVTGLLIVALIITAQQLDGLSDQSQRIVTQSAAGMRASRALIEQASAMERNARQYSIVGNREILEVYADRRRHFAQAAQEMSYMDLGEDMSDLLNQLIRSEALAYRRLISSSATDSRLLYPALMEAAYRVPDLVGEWTDRELVLIRRETNETKALLTIQAVFLVSAALLLAGIFTALITRPLLQIENAINQLGGGLYEKSINISGPRDLSSLGDRLEWLRNRLERLERHRSSFLRHVSHELKTPLAVMQESAALLRDGVVGRLSTEQKEVVRILSNNCQRLQVLIGDLLRHHSESFAVLNHMPQPVRLDKVVEEVIAAQEFTLQAAQLRVYRKLERLTVRGNHEELRVVLDNLLTNAIKFSPAQGEIEVQLEREQDEAVLDLIDQGPGIAPAEREKIFEAFYQSKPSGKSFHKGSGLGLAIVQEYVKTNGGRVRVLDHPHGARFQLRFPISGQGRQ